MPQPADGNSESESLAKYLEEFRNNTERELAVIKSRMFWLLMPTFLLILSVLGLVLLTWIRVNKFQTQVTPEQNPLDSLTDVHGLALALLISCVIACVAFTLGLWQVHAFSFPAFRQTEPHWISGFLTGAGSVLEVFPSPDTFDQWRIKGPLVDDEWSVLFRELWESRCAESARSEIKT